MLNEELINKCKKLIEEKQPKNWNDKIDIIMDFMIEEEIALTNRQLKYAIGEFLFNGLEEYNDKLADFINLKVDFA